MFIEYWRTTPVQRLLPYDATQDHYLGSWSGDPDIAAISGPWDWTASELLSQTGTIAGTSREARAGRDEPGYMAYGPYIQMAEGDYRVSIEYSSDTSQGNSSVHFDASLVGVPAAERDLEGTSGETTVVTVDFKASADIGWEFRFFWDGTSDFLLRSVRVEQVHVD